MHQVCLWEWVRVRQFRIPVNVTTNYESLHTPPVFVTSTVQCIYLLRLEQKDVFVIENHL